MKAKFFVVFVMLSLVLSACNISLPIKINGQQSELVCLVVTSVPEEELTVDVTPVVTDTVVITPMPEATATPAPEQPVASRPCFMAAEGTVKVTLDNGSIVEVPIVSPPAGTDGGPASIAPMTAAVVLPGCYIAADAQTSRWPFSAWTIRYDPGGSELGHTLLPNAPVLVFTEWGGGVNYIERINDDCGTGGCDAGIQVISVP